MNRTAKFITVTFVQMCISSTPVIADDTPSKPWFDADVICNGIAAGVSGVKLITKCEGGAYDSQDGVKVSVGMLNDLNGINMSIIDILAPSKALSGYVTGHGYESHKFELVLFKSYQNEETFWLGISEPRYIRGGLSIALQAENPNWTLYEGGEGGDRLQELRDKVKLWICRGPC